MKFKKSHFEPLATPSLNRPSRLVHSQKASKGQIIIENVLMLALVALIAFTISQAFQKGKYLQELVQSPFKQLAGMVRDGQWEADPKKSKPLHPNKFTRHFRLLGDKE